MWIYNCVDIPLRVFFYIYIYIYIYAWSDTHLHIYIYIYIVSTRIYIYRVRYIYINDANAGSVVFILFDLIHSFLDWIVCASIHPFTASCMQSIILDSLIHSMFHSSVAFIDICLDCNHNFIHSNFHWCIQSLIHWCVDSLLHRFMPALIDWLIPWCISRFIHLLIPWPLLTHWFIDSINDLNMLDLCIHSSVHAFFS